MADVVHDLDPWDFYLPSSNYPKRKIFSGSNYPVRVLAFDAATDQTCYVRFRAAKYASGNLSIDIEWYADTGSSGNVVWEVQLAAITPNSDTQDIETKSFATLNYVQDTHLGTTNQRLHQCTITVSNLDSIADMDWCVLRLARDANGTNATDDLSGDALLASAAIRYLST